MQYKPDANRAVQFLVRFAGWRETATFMFVILIMSFLDLAGIAIIFPYIQIISEPELLLSHFGLLDMETLSARKHDILLAISAALGIFYLGKGFAQSRLLRYQHRQLAYYTARLTDDTVNRILNARYGLFQEIPGSEISGIAYVNTVHATIAFRSLIQGANEAIFLLLLSAVFLVISPKLTLVVLLLLCGVVFVLYFTVVHRTLALGKTQSRVENIRYRLLFSITNAVRDIKVMGLAPRFDAKNREISAEYADVAWRYNYNGALPLLLIELVVLIAVVGAVSILIFSGLPMDKALPVIGVAAVTAVRAVPAFAKLLMALNSFRFSRSFVERLMQVRDRLAMAEHIRQEDSLSFQERIELRDIGFSYGDKSILSGVNLDIMRGNSVGIVGPSGSGKSTLLDVITGLQPATTGSFKCDGVAFDPFFSRSMQRLVGYVPQSLTLLDETIAFNITFEHDYDRERLQRAIKIANLEGFVRSLEHGIDTRMGEDGMRVSGGQRQRIGIARALYREPAILVFDEATSALDAHTERELSEEISRLRGEVTLLIVSHQLSAVMNCDRIYVLINGRVQDSGTHVELLQRCRHYKELYELQNIRQQACPDPL
jgi:ABC-type bacteriocin/lantibiotic exporter with double-glycine peptidase domain